MSNSTIVFKLADLKQIAEEISEVQCRYFGEACPVAFQKNNHTSETTVTVSGIHEASYQFAWETVKELAGWVDNDNVAEHAAIAIAFFIIDRATEYTIIRQSVKGPGFDYWLGYKKSHEKYDPNNFMIARLEVSGVFNGTDSDLKTRVKKKLKQIDKSSELDLPGYVSVTEFGKCKSAFQKK